jgi:hypothetical protein
MESACANIPPEWTRVKTSAVVPDAGFETDVHGKAA